MRRTPVPDDDGRMSKAQHHNLNTKSSMNKPLPLDGVINWGCSAKGWNCCVDQLIEIRPYDMIRLRHALERSSDELMGAETVMFEFAPATGRLLGRLPQPDRGDGHPGCRFPEATKPRARRQSAARQPPRALKLLSRPIQSTGRSGSSSHGTATSTTWPARRTTLNAWSSVEGNPAQSNTMSGPTPPVRASISATRSCSSGFMTASAPSSDATRARSGAGPET